MKQLAPLFFLLLLLSCLPSTNKKKEKANQGKTTAFGNILSENCTVEDFYFSSDNKILKKGNVVFGKTLGLRLKGISGFSVRDGKVLCDASIEVLDSNKRQVLLAEDLLSSNYPNGIDDDIFTELIELYSYMQSPVKVNERYTFVFKLKDKEGPATMEITEEFLITEED